MVNQNVLGTYDNVTFPPGTTAQSTTSTLDWGAALESYAGPSSTLFDPPNANGYAAWSLIPEDAITTNLAHTSTNGFLTRVFVPANGSVGHLDINITSSGAITNAVFGLYSASSFATGPLVWTADVHATVTGAAGLYGLTWNGASSPASVILQ